MKKLLCLLILAAAVLPMWAKISFGDYDINEKDEVLFTIKHDLKGTSSYNSLFYAKIKDGETEKTPEILTYYPERMERLSLLGGTVLQIRNRYGTARYYSATKTISWVNSVEDFPLDSLPCLPEVVSADGKWITRIEKTDVSTGDLVLESVSSGKKVVLAENVKISYEKVPVKWASDSSTLLYEKNGAVYFCTPDALLKNVEVEEKYRKIGQGNINSVEWAGAKSLVYIDDYMVYKINARELYTLGLYSGIIGQGIIIGRLPFAFVCQQDTFSVNSDVTGLVVCQDGKNFTYYRTYSASCDFMEILHSRPYTDNQSSLTDYTLFWDNYGNPILWLEKLPYNGGTKTCTVFRLNENTAQLFEIKDSGKPFLSPDGKKVAFKAGSTVYVYNTTTWNRIAILTGEKVESILWEDNNLMYVGGTKSIRIWNLEKQTEETIALSAADYGFWDSEGKIVAQKDEDERFTYSKSKGVWTASSHGAFSDFNFQNGKYRVFTGTTQNQEFANALYIRSLNSKAVTKPVFKMSTQKRDARKKIALVIDCYDNADGLAQILTVLKKYNVPATFFINGEFIRRYPNEVRQISSNGYECASMFFTASDLTDSSFVVDEDFIRRGLARNEDEFFNCTGQELSLFWHAPYYLSDYDMISYGNKAGYAYVNSFYVAGKDDFTAKPEKMVKDYITLINATGEGIIPVTTGYSHSAQKEAVYQHLDLLICALLDSGFDLVSMSNY